MLEKSKAALAELKTLAEQNGALLQMLQQVYGTELTSGKNAIIAALNDIHVAIEAGASLNDIAAAVRKIPLSEGGATWLQTFTPLIDTDHQYVNLAGIAGVGETSWRQKFASKTLLKGFSVGRDYCDTSAVTTMSYMFNGCTALTSIDLRGLDTSAVTTMSYMFNGCTAITSIDLRGLDTSAVTDMGYMFSDCTALTSIDLRGISGKSVTTFQQFTSDNMWRGRTWSYFGDSKITYEEVVEQNIKLLDGWGGTDNFVNKSSYIRHFWGHFNQVEQYGIVLDHATVRALINGIADRSDKTSLTLPNLGAILNEDDIAVLTAKNWTLA